MLLRTKDRVLIARHVYYATTFLQRLRGLMFSEHFPSGCDALLLSPCNAVHTMFMRYPIDVVFLDEAWQIVAIHPFMQPWGFSTIVKGASHVLELPPGSINRLKLTPGDSLAKDPQISQ